ncbi:MAG: lysophospholipid acyltransferase family protein [bacterium]
MIYLIARCLSLFAGGIFFRLKVSGLIPGGGVILCSNHLSNCDPPIIATSTFRKLHFMAKKELFYNPVIAFFLKKLNAFPVDRNLFDRSAFRKAVEIVNSGKNLLVFPEGTRNKTGDGKVKKIRRAVSYIIYRTEKPVIPVFIKGTNEWKELKRFSVKFGKPVDFPERKMPYTREVSEKICERIKDGIEKTAR